MHKCLNPKSLHDLHGSLTRPPPDLHRAAHLSSLRDIANLVSRSISEPCAIHVRPPPGHPQTSTRPPPDQRRAMSGNTRSISLILDLGSTSAPGISFRVFRPSSVALLRRVDVFRGFNCCFQVEPPGGASSLRRASQRKLGLPPGDECVKITHSGGPRQGHPMRHQCDIKATPMRVDSQAVATPKPPQSHPKATTKRPQCVPEAPTKRQQSHPGANAEGRMQNAEQRVVEMPRR